MQTLQETGTILQQQLVRNHGKIKAVWNRNKDKNTFNNKKVTKNQFDRRIKLRRQCKHKQQLTLNGNKALHEDLAEYGQPFESTTDTTNINMIRIHSHIINNMPQYATYIKNRSIINELKKRQLIYTYGRKLGSVGQKWIQLIIRGPEQMDWEFIQT